MSEGPDMLPPEPTNARSSTAFSLRGLLLLALTTFLAWVFHRSLGWVPLLLAAAFLAWPARGRAEGRAFLAVLGLFLATWILLQLRWIVYPLVGGLLLAVLLEPWVGTLSRRLPRGAAAALALLPLGAVLVVVILVLVPTVINEVQILVSKVPDAIRTLRQLLEPLLVRISPRGPDAPPVWPEFLSEAPQELLSRLEKLLQPAMESAAGLSKGLGRAAQLVGALFLIPVIGYYLLVDWSRFRSGAESLLPPRWLPRARHVGSVSAVVFRTYLRGQLLVAAIEAALYAVGFGLAGVPEAVALGVLAGFFSLIPVLGFGITALVAVLSALIAPDPLRALLGAGIVLAAVQMLEGQLLVPRIQGQGLGLHPLAVLVGVLGLGVLFGVMGALFAVPVLGVFAALWPELRDGYHRSRFFRGRIGPT